MIVEGHDGSQDLVDGRDEHVRLQGGLGAAPGDPRVEHHPVGPLDRLGPVVGVAMEDPD